jgi:hypothetical protein
MKYYVAVPEHVDWEMTLHFEDPPTTQGGGGTHPSKAGHRPE